MKQQIFCFLIVGTIGFIVDGGGVWLLTSLTTVSPIIARVPAMSIAIIVTFCLNRSLTFRAHHQSIFKSFIAYLSANAVSQGFNFMLYSLLLLMSAFLYDTPVVALAISSIAAMSLSFVFSKYWVFKAYE